MQVVLLLLQVNISEGVHEAVSARHLLQQKGALIDCDGQILSANVLLVAFVKVVLTNLL